MFHGKAFDIDVFIEHPDQGHDTAFVLDLKFYSLLPNPE